MSFMDKRVYKAFVSSKECTEIVAKYLDSELQGREWKVKSGACS